MKKIIIVLYLVLIISITGLFLYGNSKRIELKFYTIRENYSYVYEDGRNMTFNIYSKAYDPMIIYPDYNSYTIRLDSLSYTLEDIKIEKHETSDINVIKITTELPKLTDKELKSSTFKLDIKNGEYSLLLDLGTFSMIDSKYYPNLILDGLSGSYSNINGYNNLVGINLLLNGDYNFMNSFRIGGFTSGIISKTKSKINYSNEINIYEVMPDYIETKIDNDYVYGIKDKMMFIPIGYKMTYLTRSGYIVINLDGNNYYFDNFPYMTTDPVFSKYKDYLTEGSIYA